MSCSQLNIYRGNCTKIRNEVLNPPLSSSVVKHILDAPTNLGYSSINVIFCHPQQENKSDIGKSLLPEVYGRE